MGLAIGLGVLADLKIHDSEGEAWMRKQIAQLNLVLTKNGLAQHDEPEVLSLPSRRSTSSFPYSCLHYLRRAYACVVEGKPVRTGEISQNDFAFISDVSVTTMDSHLLMHSDAEGFYVPQSFRDPICDDRVPGGFVGSSQRLRYELYRVGPGIGIPIKNGKLPPEVEEKLAHLDGPDPLLREKMVWFALFEATRISIDHKTLIVFH
jgi:hypothetical protein